MSFVMTRRVTAGGFGGAGAGFRVAAAFGIGRLYRGRAAFSAAGAARG
jgi:hypothetical protein